MNILSQSFRIPCTFHNIKWGGETGKLAIFFLTKTCAHISGIHYCSLFGFTANVHHWQMASLSQAYPLTITWSYIALLLGRVGISILCILCSLFEFTANVYHWQMASLWQAHPLTITWSYIALLFAAINLW